MAFVVAIDQGTTSSRCFVFGADGSHVAHAQREHQQIFLRPGWVEHDATEIWRNVQTVIDEAMASAAITARDVAAVGITNQRETTLIWDAATGEPIGNAIVWQDTRTADMLAAYGDINAFRASTGLPLATYFSAPKLRWLLDAPGNVRSGRQVLAGTMDSWLIYKLTGRHAIDVTNASRTMLMNLATLDWDPQLLAAFSMPREILPEIAPSSGFFGEIQTGPLQGVPITGVLGDQQAALVGQACFAPGEAKCTYGTGAFLLLNTGDEAVLSEQGLVTTVAYQRAGEPPAYALEGSIAVAGSLVQWLRDNLGLIRTADEVNQLAAQVPDNGGCYLVPAFSGLFAPYWRPDARGVICGLTSFVTKAHLARAVLEATAWQVRDVVQAMAGDFASESDRRSATPRELSIGALIPRLNVDGGMAASDLLLQIQADLLDVAVVRSAVTETTVLGAAYAAGLAAGVWPDADALRQLWRADREWSPQLPATDREMQHRHWQAAIERSLGWVSS